MKSYSKDNNDILIYLKNAILSKKIRFLVDESIKSNDFINDKKFHTDGEYHAEMLMPFIQTSQFVFETLNLECELKNDGNWAIKNTAKRKDRFSSMAYANYLAELIEKEEYRNKRNNKSPDFFMLFN